MGQDYSAIVYPYPRVPSLSGISYRYLAEPDDATETENEAMHTSVVFAPPPLPPSPYPSPLAAWFAICPPLYEKQGSVGGKPRV